MKIVGSPLEGFGSACLLLGALLLSLAFCQQGSHHRHTVEPGFRRSWLRAKESIGIST
jgi:hypothetical protein